jgi:hypothetical protein
MARQDTLRGIGKHFPRSIDATGIGRDQSVAACKPGGDGEAGSAGGGRHTRDDQLTA